MWDDIANRMENNSSKALVIEWPYHNDKYECLVNKFERNPQLEKQLTNKSCNVIILDNILLRNVEFNFVEWEFLAEKSKVSLKTIQLQQTCRLIDRVFKSLNAGSSVRNLKLKNDHSEEVGKAMIEQCFYEEIKQNKNKETINLSQTTIIFKCEQFHQVNHIASWASWSSWVNIKRQITRCIYGYINEQDNNIHWFKDTSPTPALTEWMKNHDVSLNDKNELVQQNDTKSSTHHQEEEEEKEQEEEQEEPQDDDDTSTTPSKNRKPVGIAKNGKSKKKSTKKNAKQNVEKDLNKNIPNNKINPTLNQTASIPNNKIIKQGKKPNPKLNKKEETTNKTKKKDVMDNKSELTLNQFEKEEPSEDTFEDMISSICQNVFLDRWFVAEEFYATFLKLFEDQVSSDCHACKRIMKESYHPKTNIRMFHTQQRKNFNQIILDEFYFCWPVGQCSICEKSGKTASDTTSSTHHQEEEEEEKEEPQDDDDTSTIPSKNGKSKKNQQRKMQNKMLKNIPSIHQLKTIKKLETKKPTNQTNQCLFQVKEIPSHRTVRRKRENVQTKTFQTIKSTQL